MTTPTPTDRTPSMIEELEKSNPVSMRLARENLNLEARLYTTRDRLVTILATTKDPDTARLVRELMTFIDSPLDTPPARRRVYAPPSVTCRAPG